MEKLVKVKFVIQPPDIDEDPDMLEHFHAAFPATDLPKTGDFIARKISGPITRMYVVERKFFGIKRGSVGISYYTGSEYL